jgi:hypothetical protein
MIFGARQGSGAIQKAAGALAAANGVAHVAFLSLFGWRLLASGPIGKVTAIVFAALAAVGLGADVLGWALVKHGGRTKVRTFGLWAVALSTALAAALLFLLDRLTRGARAATLA